MINLNKLAAIAKATPKTEVNPASSLGKLNEEKLSRRAALRRIGMTGGIAVLGLLTVDDLARVAAKKLEQNELTRGIAKDFKSAGVAFAGPSVRSICEMGCDNQHTGDVADCGPAPSPLNIVAAAAHGYCILMAWKARNDCLDGCLTLGTD